MDRDALASGSRFHLSENETPSSSVFTQSADQQEPVFLSGEQIDAARHLKSLFPHKQGSMDSSQAFKTVIHTEAHKDLGDCFPPNTGIFLYALYFTN